MSGRMAAIAALAEEALRVGNGAGGTSDRRPSETCTVVWRGQEIAVTAGFRPVGGSVIDVTARGWRTGADLQSLVDDACCVIAAALQRGLTAGELRRLTGTVPSVVDGVEREEPASVIGAILRAVETLEGAG